jgi:hypothetical protein
VPDEGETPEDTRRMKEERRADSAAQEETRERGAEAEAEAGRWRINKQKQARHMEGTKEYDKYAETLAERGLRPSVLMISEADLSEILADLRVSEGALPVSGKSRMILDRVVGMYYDSKGQGPFKSNVLMIHVSKTGIHAYPAKPQRE